MSWRRAALVTGAFAVLSMLSCMSFNIGGKVYECKTEDGLLIQQGQARVPAGVEQDVYYPVPYASTPNLETSDCWSSTIVVMQCPTHFRVRNTSDSVERVEWTVRGVRGVPVAVGGPGPALGPPSSLPPPRPIPVDPKAGPH